MTLVVAKVMRAHAHALDFDAPEVRAHLGDRLCGRKLR